MVNDDNNTPTNDRLAQLLLDEIPAPAADYWTRIDATLTIAAADTTAGTVREIGTQTPKKTAAALINWRTTPLLIAAAAILIAGLVIVFRNNSETAIDTFDDPSASLNAALDAVPGACFDFVPESGGLISVDFIEKVRQAEWYPGPTEVGDLVIPGEWLFDVPELRWSASEQVFAVGTLLADRFRDGFGYDIEDADIALNVPCPSSDENGNLLSSGGSSLLLAAGSFDVDVVERVTADDPVWGKFRTTANAGGREYFAWDLAGGSSREVIEAGTPGRRTGIGGQLYINDSVSIRSASHRDALGPLFDAQATPEQQASHDDWTALIGALERSDFLTAHIYNPQRNELVPVELITAPLHTAFGAADSGTAPVAALAFNHATAEAAQANAAAIVESGRIAALGGKISVSNNDKLVTIVFEDRAADEAFLLLELWNNTLVDAIRSPDSAATQAVAAIPAPCLNDVLSIDFLDQARQASWWPEETELPSEAQLVQDRLLMQASDLAFNFVAIEDERFRESFGYDVVDSEIVLIASCPRANEDGELAGAAALHLAVGSFDVQAVDQATLADREFGEHRYTATSAGRTYYAYEDLGTLGGKTGPGALRVSGQGGQLYVDDSLAIRVDGRWDSLGPLFAASSSTAEQTARQGMLTRVEMLRNIGYISVELRSASDISPNPMPESGRTAPHVASGVIDDGDGPKIAITFIHEFNVGQAARTAELFEQSDYLSANAPGYRVETDGEYVTVVVDIDTAPNATSFYASWRRGISPGG